ncbi:hypothetical protein EV363DRAFT_1182750 [Boletus edulis]|nr:hypothetical protein EV363DRAFT_1182750 [Boletus edulis]
MRPNIFPTSWSEKTKETYGSSLLVFHVFCDIHEVPDEQRAPASQSLLSSFVAGCAGSYSGSAISNHIAGIRAWHLLHGVPWRINASETQSIVEGATRLAPSSLALLKRAPFERRILLLFLTYLNLSEPRDAAIFACIVITFYSVSRLGEFTVPSLVKYASSPSLFIQRQHLTPSYDHNNIPTLSFCIPVTKCSKTGETTQCATLDHLTDPVTWLQNHFNINNPGSSNHLFAWRHPKGLRPLTKTEVTKRIQEIVTRHNLPTLKGHSLRIGGTLHYLLLGTPFDVVQAMGRWSSNSFTLYLRKHAIILAPYLQERPYLVERLTNLAMPPVR